MHTLFTLYGLFQEASRGDPEVGRPASTIRLHNFSIYTWRINRTCNWDQTYM